MLTVLVITAHLLVAPAACAPPDYKTAATTMIRAFAKGDLSALERAIASGRSIRVKVVAENMGNGPPKQKLNVALSTSKLLKSYAEKIKDWSELTGESTMDDCRGSCCASDKDVLCGGAGDDARHLTTICLASGPKGELLPVSLSVFECGGH